MDRAPQTDLTDLVTHNTSADMGMPLETVSELAHKKRVEYVAITSEQRVVGLCSIRRINSLLSERYGHAIHSKRPVGNYMVESPCFIRPHSQKEDVFNEVFQRSSDSYYEDLICVDGDNSLVGLIPTEAIVKLQHTTLLNQLEQTDQQRQVVVDQNQKLQAIQDKLEQTNQQLIDARNLAEQATALKSEFLANMSHEIRTPMNGVVGMLSILAETTLNEEQVELVKIADGSAHTLLRIINDILDFSKIEAGKLDIERVPFEPDTIINTCLKLYQSKVEAKKLSIELATEPLNQTFLGDPVRLQQIITNLISNAVKFTKTGGIILQAKVNFSSKQRAQLNMSIQDTGIGMKEAHRQGLFQPFMQADSSTSRHFGGTGLGLSISRKLANLMGGDLSCESTLGVGSTFLIELPFEIATSESTKPIEHISGSPLVLDAESIDASNLRVLVVEDNQVNQLVAKRFLTKLGCQVDICENGLEAIDMITEINYDMVLMDCQMPVLDGYEATRRIRKGEAGAHNKELFIVAVTAHAMKGDLEHCLRSGMDKYLSKPITLSDLQAALKASYSRSSK